MEKEAAVRSATYSVEAAAAAGKRLVRWRLEWSRGVAGDQLECDQRSALVVWVV
jgi:hypothetical protein